MEVDRPSTDCHILMEVERKREDVKMDGLPSIISRMAAGTPVSGQLLGLDTWLPILQKPNFFMIDMTLRLRCYRRLEVINFKNPFFVVTQNTLFPRV